MVRMVTLCLMFVFEEAGQPTSGQGYPRTFGAVVAAQESGGIDTVERKHIHPSLRRVLESSYILGIDPPSLHVFYFWL